MKLEAALLVLTVIGAASSFLALRDYYSATPICRVDERWSCKAVYSIREAKILGLHLSILAPIYFSTLLVLVITYLYTGIRQLLASLAALSVAGLIMVPYLIYLEVSVAHAFCLHCTIMHIVIILTSILSLYACIC